MADLRVEPVLARSIGAPRRLNGVLLPWCVASLIVSTALAGSLLWPPVPVLLWNASASSKIGLYRVTQSARPRVGDTVVAWAPSGARRLAATRRYLPSNVPLVKRVGAIAGDRVCAARDQIFVNGRVAALRRSRDPAGRAMPWWSGCRVLRPGQLFLLSAGVSQAFDGRYFGVTRRGELVGKAKLLWARGSNDG
jgi:conjugative transfer signal peptidase TraF